MSTIGLWFYRNEGGQSVLDRLVATLEHMGHEVVHEIDLRTCTAVNGTVRTPEGVDLCRLDCLLVMNADEQSAHQRDTCRALDLAGVPLVNSYASFENAQDKFVANTLLARGGIPVPRSALVPTDAASMVPSLFEAWGSVVVKERRRHGGIGVQRFDSTDRLLDYFDAVGDVRENHYLEEFVEFGDRDIRVDLIDGEFVGGYRRRRAHYFKTNVHYGASMLPESPDEDAIELATEAARVLGVSVTIVDLVRRLDTGELVVLEVNPMLGVFTEAGLRAGINTVQSASDIHPIYAYDDRKIELLAAHLHRVARAHEEQRLPVPEAM